MKDVPSLWLGRGEILCTWFGGYPGQRPAATGLGASHTGARQHGTCHNGASRKGDSQAHDDRPDSVRRPPRF